MSWAFEIALDFVLCTPEPHELVVHVVKARAPRGKLKALSFDPERFLTALDHGPSDVLKTLHEES